MMNHQVVTHSVRYLCRYRAARAAKKDNCEPRLRILCPTSGHGLFDNIHAVFKLLKGWSSQTARLLRMIMEMMSTVRVAEVPQSREGPSPKSLDSDENLKPEHTLFCRELRFVAIYAHFGNLWAKKVPFWVKNSVSWARSALLHGIYCIFH